MGARIRGSHPSTQAPTCPDCPLPHSHRAPYLPYLPYTLAPVPLPYRAVQPSYHGRDDLVPALDRGLGLLRASVVRTIALGRFRATHMREAAQLQVRSDNCCTFIDCGTCCNL